MHQVNLKGDTAMMGYGDFGSMGGFGWIWMVLVWAFVIALLVWGTETVFGRRGVNPDLAPLEILQRRYAAGEIAAAEFEQAKRALA